MVKKKAKKSTKKSTKKPTKKAPQKNKGGKTEKVKKNKKKEFPKLFPFWARLKISKNRTTLVIDEDTAYDKQKKREVEGFVHREATHPKHKGAEMIFPNPDKDDKEPMYLKSPTKLPKKLFSPHNKELDMPEHLKQRYEKNNKKAK